MKILTLNTHSILEKNYEQKLSAFVDVVSKEQPDIIALQEVNQSAGGLLADLDLVKHLVPCPGNDVPIRQDNHAARAAALLRKKGLNYSWTWVPGKLGYGKYDEGMAFFSLNHEITEVDSFYISGCRDYQNWKTRRVLGIQTDRDNSWFYTAHMGWWQDAEEPFLPQWECLHQTLLPKQKEADIWLMGDFNSPAEVRSQGYDCIRSSGWQDTYLLAEEKDGGITVEGVIDGWREYLTNPSEVTGMRIDHIWCSKEAPIRRSTVIFNGTNGPVVSDHFGVIIEF